MSQTVPDYGMGFWGCSPGALASWGASRDLSEKLFENITRGLTVPIVHRPTESSHSTCSPGAYKILVWFWSQMSLPIRNPASKSGYSSLSLKFLVKQESQRAYDTADIMTATSD